MAAVIAILAIVLAFLATVVAVALYLFMTSTADYWARCGVPFLPSTPFLGSDKRMLLATTYRGIVAQDFYNYAKKRGLDFLGVFVSRRPALVVCDVELAKTMLVKDFQYLTDRGTYFDRERDPLTANLFNLEGSVWRNIRQKLTPTFTSGKMKNMFYLVAACTAELDHLLAAEVDAGHVLEMGEIMARFGTDIIGSCAFGVDANSIKNPNAEFRIMGRKTFEAGVWTAFMRFLGDAMPQVRSFMPATVVPKDVTDFFTKTLNDNIRHREENGIVRHDFLDLLIQLKRKEIGGRGATANDPQTDRGIDPDILPAQAFVFFLAGFETSSSATSACLLELSQHLDVQDKLRDEVDRVLAKYGGESTYEALQEMTYMEQVLEETMRLYPALGILPRVVTRDYRLPNTKVVVPAGTRVLFPVYAFHRDPDHYPDPDRFNPNHFSEESKATRHHFAYMPFGEGPRICIGLRFAMMQMKAALTMIIKSYQIRACEETVYPPEFEPKSFVTKIKDGVTLKLTRR